MPSAQVNSVDAIEAFRSTLVVFLANARATLDEVNSDILRTRLWLEDDQRRVWEKQLRACALALEHAQSEMFGARLSQFHETLVEKQMAVRRTRQAVMEAEEKIKKLKRWERELEHTAEPMLKQVDHLQSFLSSDMARAVVQLDELIKTLQAYAGITSPAPATATTTENKTA